MTAVALGELSRLRFQACISYSRDSLKGILIGTTIGLY